MSGRRGGTKQRVAVGVALVSCALTFVAAAVAASAKRSPVPTAPPRGVIRVIAHVPNPGDPALPLVFHHDIWEGTYSGASQSSAPSRLFEFSAYGRLLRNIVVPGQELSQPHGIQVATRTANGDLVVLDDTSGRVLIFSPKTGRFRLYATIPNIPNCSSDGNKEPCTSGTDGQNLTPEPDYAIWDPEGRLYITDYQQGVIWRIPAGGGKPSAWLSGAALAGSLFGTAGISILPNHRTILFDQASNGGLAGSSASTGKLYSVAIEPDGKPGPLHLLWTSAAAAAPDGFALARSGHIYLAQVGPSGNDVVELSSSGKLIATFGTPVSGSNGSSIPFDEPSGVAFIKRELVIANQSYAAGDSAHMALLGLGTGELGLPIYVPKHAGVARHR